MAPGGRIHRQPRLGHHDRPGPESDPAAIPLHQPGRATRRRSTSRAARVQPVLGLVPGETITTHRRAIAAAAAVSRSSPACQPRATTARAVQLGAVRSSRPLQRTATRCWRLHAGRGSASACRRLNPTDTDFEERLGAPTCRNVSRHEHPYELPFGRGRNSASDAGRLVDAFIGGWSFQAIGSSRAADRSTSGTGTSITTATSTQLKAKYRATPTCRCSTSAGSISTTRRCRPTAWTTRSSSARIADPAREQRPLLPVAAQGVRGPTLNDVGHLVRQAGPARRQRPGPVQHRVPQRVQPDVSSTTRTRTRRNATSAR